MTFEKLKERIESEFGTSKLSDIARELNVSPQVVSNWKARNQVPYKYIKKLRKKIREKNFNSYGEHPSNISEGMNKNISDLDSAQTYDDNLVANLEDMIFSVYEKILSNLKSFLIPPIVLFIIGVIDYKFYTVPVFTAKAKILPISTQNKKGGMSSLASQFGLNLGGASSSEGLSDSRMVPFIIKSRMLARDLLSKKFTTIEQGKDKSLIRILFRDTISTDFSEKRISKAINKLSKMVKIKGGHIDNPLIEIRVNTWEAEFSKVLADTIIKRLNNIMTEFRLKQIKEKKSFIKTRLLEVGNKLKLAEETLRDFRDQNRSIYSSPALMLEQSRIARDLEVQNQLHITLVTQFEMIKIEESGQTDMLQTLDAPEVPIVRTSPIAVRLIGAYLIAGFIFGISIIFGKDWILKNKTKILDPIFNIIKK